MDETKEKTALVTSVGTDERQSVQNTTSSIPTSGAEINDQFENSEENLEKMLWQMQRMSDPAYEFIWENQRRRDMIRFGSYFTDTWFYKTGVTEEWRGIYPIPAIQLNNNPNLKQNPNY